MVELAKGTEEDGLTYLAEGHGDDVTITVSLGDKTLVEEYSCFHRPIFGYDVDDLEEINNQMDIMIRKIRSESKY